MIHSSKPRRSSSPDSATKLAAPRQLAHSANERQHHVQVRTAAVPYSSHGCEFQREEIRVARIAKGTAHSDHRVGFGGLEAFATLEIAKLVRTKVDGAVRDRPWHEAARERLQTRGHALGEFGSASLVDQKPGMPPFQGFKQHQLGSQQADAVDIEGSSTLHLRRL